MLTWNAELHTWGQAIVIKYFSLILENRHVQTEHA